MHAIDIGGDRYIKAADAAELTGYATDYIGQLSRGKKISAERVGRIWYVSEREILAHKKGIKRSNKQKTHESLKHQIAEHGQIHHAYFDPVQEAHMPEYRKRLLASEIKYEDDRSPLKQALSEKSRLSEISTIEIDPEISDEEVDLINEEGQRAVNIALVADTHASAEETEEEMEPVPTVETSHVAAEEAIPVRVSVESRPVVHKTKHAGPIPLVEMHPVPYGKPSYALMIPVAGYVASLMLAFALMASLGGIFVEKVMVYEQGERLNEAPRYESSYGMRAVSAVIQSIPR